MIELSVEASAILSVYHRFYHRLSYAIRHPDLLTQELYVQGIIDQYTEVSEYEI